jgi:hypothetical protein
MRSSPALGEIRVGYSSFTSSERSAVVQSVRKKRVTDQYIISGKNVIPVNGKNKFNRDTIWKINNENKKFSLFIEDENPRTDLLNTDTTTESVVSSRKESVVTSVTGFDLTKTRKSLSPLSQRSLPPIVPVSTSVFDF